MKLAQRYGFMVISDFAYADVAFDGYQPPSFLASPGAADVGVEFTTMSKGYNMAGWRVGFCSRQPRDDPRPGHDQGLLRLRHVPGDPDRRHHGPAARRRRHGEPGRASTKAAATRSCESLHRIGWPVTPPKASMFCWVPIPEPWRSRMSTMDFGMMLLEKGNVAVSPGSGFGPAGEGFLRMSLVENEARLRQAVRQIKACLRDADTANPSASATIGTVPLERWIIIVCPPKVRNKSMQDTLRAIFRTERSCPSFHATCPKKPRWKLSSDEPRIIPPKVTDHKSK